MKNLTLRHLRYFEAIARHRHFGRAAEACSISQPALSMQIKELENLFGATLIERGSRQLRLSGLGEVLVDRVRGILRSVDELDDLVRSADGPLTGRLRIGVIPTIAPYYLPLVIATLNAHNPKLEIWPREAVTEKLIRDLEEARLDFAIVALPISEPTIQEEPLFDEEFVLVRPIDDADARVPNARQLSEMRLLLLEEGHCFRDQALSYCSPSARPPRGIMECSSLSTLVQMVEAGIGVTLVPEMAVPTETRSANVSVARLSTPRPKRSVGMVWRSGSPLASQYLEMARTLRDLKP